MGFDLLGGSIFYRLLGRILDGIEQAARTSAIARLIACVRRLAAFSVIVRFCTRIADAFGTSIRESAIVTWLLKEDESGRFRERGLFFRLYLVKLRILRKLWCALRLDKFFADSIFIKPWIWVIATMALLPLLPTMAVLGITLLAAGSLLLAMLQNPARGLVYSAVSKYVWFYMFVYGLATLVSVTPRASLNVGLITIAFVLFYHVLISGIETRRQLRFLIGALAFVGAIVSVYGIWQFFNPANYAEAWLDSEMFEFNMRVFSTFGNPNVLGMYFLLVIPLNFAGLIISKTNRGRLYFLGAGGLMCLCLVLTYSRGAYLGLLIAAAIFLVLLDRRFIVPGILAVILIFLAMPGAILERFFSIGDLGDTSTSYRVFIWLGTISMLRDYWFSGVGPGEAAWAQVYPAYAFSQIIAPHSHNLFLQIMVDAGAPGLAVFLGALYQYFKATFAALRRKVQGEQRVLVIAGIASVAGFLVQGMTDYTFYNYRVMLFFWGVLAIGVMATRYDKLRECGKDGGA